MNATRLAPPRRIGAQLHVSFEFFPPKTDEMEERLWETVSGWSRSRRTSSR